MSRLNLEQLQLLTADQLEKITLDDTPAFWYPLVPLRFRDAERQTWTVGNYSFRIKQEDYLVKIDFYGMSPESYDISLSAVSHAGGSIEFFAPRAVKAFRQLATLLGRKITVFHLDDRDTIPAVTFHELPRDHLIALNAYLVIRTIVFEDQFHLLDGVPMAESEFSREVEDDGT